MPFVSEWDAAVKAAEDRILLELLRFEERALPMVTVVCWHGHERLVNRRSVERHGAEPCLFPCESPMRFVRG